MRCTACRAKGFAGPRTTAAVGALVVAAQVFLAVPHGGLTTSSYLAQIAALTLLSVLIVLITLVRERRRRLLARAQSVAEAANAHSCAHCRNVSEHCRSPAAIWLPRRRPRSAATSTPPPVPTTPPAC
ncbi:hypothetical protein [Streptomyces sp. NPDC001657]|uniref:hypothetical protein n=1 Tax=Streptomyces sp. NPDC001657 TaxID=3154522 RepID=UPI003327F14B